MDDMSAPAPVVAVVLVAAGAGTRLGAELPKAFAPLGEGTVLEHAMLGVRRAATLAQLVVVVPAGRIEDAAVIARRVYPDRADELVTIVAGGPTRAHSVVAGLAAVDTGIRAVLVHDAARALTPPELFDSVAAAVLELDSGVIPGLPIWDTVKRVDRSGEVLETLDRAELFAVQTPQGFPREAIVEAYRAAGDVAAQHTDDAGIATAHGLRVASVLGSDRAFKITTPADLARADALLRGTAASTAGSGLRTGVGVDSHRLATGIPLWLGGIEWPGATAGLEGHSDGDVAAHAIVDALLAAGGLGDIGTRFGVADPRYAGASGATFLSETRALLADAGWTIESAAVEIVANAPSIASRREEMQRVLSELVGAPVAVAGTTSDGLGLTGEGAGIAAIATALVSR